MPEGIISSKADLLGTSLKFIEFEKHSEFFKSRFYNYVINIGADLGYRPNEVNFITVIQDESKEDPSKDPFM